MSSVTNTFLSLLNSSNFNDTDRNTILNFLKICDSIHDFKGSRAGDNISENPIFQAIKAKNKVIQTIFPSTVEHNAEELLINTIPFSPELKLNLIKLINNSNYKYEITINNELQDIDNTNSQYYMQLKQSTKEFYMELNSEIKNIFQDKF